MISLTDTQSKIFIASLLAFVALNAASVQMHGGAALTLLVDPRSRGTRHWHSWNTNFGLHTYTTILIIYHVCHQGRAHMVLWAWAAVLVVMCFIYVIYKVYKGFDHAGCLIWCFDILMSSPEIGMGLTGFGVFFLLFGMMLFFDKALLAIGNVSKSTTPPPPFPRVIWRMSSSFRCRFFSSLVCHLSSAWSGRLGFSSSGTKSRPPVSFSEECWWSWWAGPSLESFWKSTASSCCSGEPSAPLSCHPFDRAHELTPCFLSFPAWLTGVSSRWRWASLDGFLCSVPCSTYLGSVRYVSEVNALQILRRVTMLHGRITTESAGIKML